MACQSCAKILKFQEKHLGRKIHCPHCGHPQILEQSAVDSDDATRASLNPDATPRQRPLSYPTAAPPYQTQDLGAPSLMSQGLSFLGPPEGPDEIGRLGGYRILSQLGAGGMGIVYLAEDVSLKRKIAIKVLPPNALTDSTSRDRFYREAQAAAALEHENIITVHQVGEDRGVVFLAMPLLRGKALDQHLSENGHNPLPVDEIVRIGHETAAGLAAAHEQGLVHRDIKPANIWLEDVADRNGQPFRIKILDFGLARFARDHASLTQTGIIVGTPSYMSPEQARSPKVDGRSDLFSLGCVLYESATGRRPFTGSDAMSVLSSLAVDVPLPPVELNGDIPFELSDLIMDLLEKDPTSRPPTARDVQDRLRALKGGSGVVERTTRIAPSSPSRQRDKTRQIAMQRGVSRLWLWVGGGVSLMFFAVIVVVGVWATNSPKDVKPARVVNEAKAPKEIKPAVVIEPIEPLWPEPKEKKAWWDEDKKGKEFDFKGPKFEDGYKKKKKGPE